MLRVASTGGLAILLAVACHGDSPARKLFVDSNPQELVRAVPALTNVQFDSTQASLDELLRVSGDNLGSMLGKLANLSAAEDIHEIRLEDGMAWMSRREAFRYAVKLLPNDSQQQFEEFRIDANTKTPIRPPAHADFLVTGHFFKLLAYLLPQYQGESRFRYIGRSNVDGQNSLILAFAQHPEASEPGSHIQIGGRGQTAHMQGLAWIDGATHRIVRIRLDMLGPIAGFPLRSLSTDISVVPVSFQSIEGDFWLPARVTVHARYEGGELHSVHRYSDYRLDAGNRAGTPAVTAASGEDAYEALARGIDLSEHGKPGEALAPLREVLRLNPELPAAHFYLANVLRGTGDLAGAESELREAARLMPGSAPIYNLFGVVLSKRGDLPNAVAEFRKSVELQPKEAIAHFNLAQVLEKSGDRTAALAEYRMASELAPENPTFQAQYSRLTRAGAASPAPPSETTIRVDVRQVLVPVVVMDKNGHYVTGLKQSDFQVFEDGVEQKISVFSVEDAGLERNPSAATEAPPGIRSASEPAPAPVQAKPAPVRRTYVVCIDSLHAGFGNLSHVRQALEKLFRTEQAGDSQYILLAIGTSTQLLEDTTADPDKVLQAVASKQFQKLFLMSQKGSTEADIREFRRTLDEVRTACDMGQADCIRKNQLSSEANQIASVDRVYTMSFLGQLQSIVKQVSAAGGRRTMVLISDGFQMVPGKLAFDLLDSYFPELHVALRTVDRMPDLEPILRLAANANVPIYTIDSRGLYTSSFFDASNSGGLARLMPAVLSIMNSNATDAGNTLSEIAAATGGTTFQNRNDLLTGLQRAFADGREYYILAYVPANANQDGKFRAISVRLQDKKMVVKTKRGYWAAAN